MTIQVTKVYIKVLTKHLKGRSRELVISVSLFVESALKPVCTGVDNLIWAQCTLGKTQPRAADFPVTSEDKGSQGSKASMGWDWHQCNPTNPKSRMQFDPPRSNPIKSNDNQDAI